MKTFIVSALTVCVLLGGEFEIGKNVFKEKCSKCHSGYISPDIIKENFFEKNNTLLKLKAPTENMLVYAIMDSSKHIGDPNDDEMRQEEIADFLKEYLENPSRDNSICDKVVMRFYDVKKPIKNITEKEYMALSKFFMEYKKHKKSNLSIKVFNKNYSEKQILKDAKEHKKNIIVEATSKYCHYCKNFKREVLSSKDVQNLLSKNYIFVEVFVDKFKLPFGLEKIYQKITPSFFFLDNNGKLLEHYPGSWRKKDFLTILKNHSKNKGNK